MMEWLSSIVPIYNYGKENKTPNQHSGNEHSYSCQGKTQDHLMLLLLKCLHWKWFIESQWIVARQGWLSKTVPDREVGDTGTQQGPICLCLLSNSNLISLMEYKSHLISLFQPIPYFPATLLMLSFIKHWPDALSAVTVHQIRYWYRSSTQSL